MVAPVIGAALVGGGASILGGVFGDNSAKKAAARAAAANERQLKNQHQWEVADLRKAGLNPILSGTGGGGSGTISTPVAQTGQTGRAISDSVGKVLSAKLLQAQTENVDADTRNKNLTYQWDRYFMPRERMASLQSGKGAYAGQNIALDTARQGLENLRKDFDAKSINVEQARDLLKRLRSDPEFLDYFHNAPYADQSKIDRLLRDGDISSGINLLMQILRK